MRLPAGAAYLAGRRPAAAILLHGRNQHPDGVLIGPLRRALAARGGLHTLALTWSDQGPRPEQHLPLFPAIRRDIADALVWLAVAQGAQAVHLVGHSLGARIAASFLAQRTTPDPVPIPGFAGLGMRNGGAGDLATDASLRRLRAAPAPPRVLDLYGDRGAPPYVGPDGDAAHAAARRDLVGPGYLQELLPGASHAFLGHEDAVADRILAWLPA